MILSLHHIKHLLLYLLDSHQMKNHFSSDLTSNLIFNEAHLHDSGTYKCEAKDKFSTIEKTINITVVEPPHIIIPPQNDSILQNENITLICRSSDIHLKVSTIHQFHLV